MRIKNGACLILHQLLYRDGLLFCLVGLSPDLLEDEAGREGVAVDAAVAIRTLPEPAIDCLLYCMQEVLAHLQCGTDTVIERER